jgi:hypothetical protein
MNFLLGINAFLAVLALFASTLWILGWIGLKLLKQIARLLQPLIRDEQEPVQHARPYPHSPAPLRGEG